ISVGTVTTNGGAISLSNLSAMNSTLGQSYGVVASVLNSSGTGLGVGGPITVYGNAGSVVNGTGVSIGSIVSGGGAVNLVGLATASTVTASSTGMTLGNISTGNGTLNINATLSGTLGSGYGLYLTSRATLASTSGAITINAASPNPNGIALYGNSASINSNSGNVVVNAYATNLYSYVIYTPLSINSGSGSLAMNVAGGNVAINQATLGGIGQSGDISVHVDSPRLTNQGLTAQTSGGLTVGSGSGLASLAGASVSLGSTSGLATPGTFTSVTIGDAHTSNAGSDTNFAVTKSLVISALTQVSMANLTTDGADVQITAGSGTAAGQGGVITVGTISSNGGSITLNNMASTTLSSVGISAALLDSHSSTGSMGGDIVVSGTIGNVANGVAVSVGTVLSAGGAVTLAGTVADSASSGNTRAAIAVEIGKTVDTSGGPLVINALASSAANTNPYGANALVFDSGSTMLSSGGAVTLNATNMASIGSAVSVSGTGVVVDSGGGQFTANWYNAASGSVETSANPEALTLRSGSGDLTLNLASGGSSSTGVNGISLGGASQSGDIKIHADVTNLSSAQTDIQSSGTLSIQSGTSLYGATASLGSVGSNVRLNGTFAGVTIGDANTNAISVSSISASGAVAVRSKTGASLSGQVNAGSLILGGTGDTQNYIFNNSLNHIGVVAGNVGSATIIDAQALTVGSGRDTAGVLQTGLTASGKVTLSATGGDLTLNAPVTAQAGAGSVAVILATDKNFVNNIGATGVNPGSGNWLIYSNSIASDYFGNSTVGFLNSNNLPIYNSGYTVGVTPSGVVAGKSYYIFKQAGTNGTPAPIYFSATITYTGSSIVSANALIMNPVFGDVSISASGSVTLASKNVGSETITHIDSISGLTGSAAANYTIGSTYGVVSITPAAITVSGLSVANKTYDATTSATLVGSATSMSGVIGGDTVSVNTAALAASFGSKNAGVQTATFSGGLLSGVDAANYTLAFATGLNTATISRANVTVSGVSVVSRTYDATTSATLDGVASVTGRTGAMSADVVNLDSAALMASFGSKNAGTQTATLTGYVLSGRDAANYNLIVPTNLTASISQASLTVSGVSVLGRTYDATTNATLSGTVSSLVGAVAGDTVALNSAALTAVFGSKNAGIETAAITGYTLAGIDARNYTVVLASSAATAMIEKAYATISGASVANRTYDATTSASIVSMGSITGRTGAMTADAVSLSSVGLSASFGSKNAGVQTATLTGATLTGADADNYVIAKIDSDLRGTIAQAALTLNGVSVASRTYDATTNATVVGTGTLSARTGAMSADTVSLASGALSATFGSKNAGQQTATLTGYSLSGADAANYVAVLAQPSALASITQAQITVSGATVANRTYDATTSATVTGIGSLSARTGAMSADVVSLSSSGLTATFGSKNAGVQTATVSGYTLTGTDAQNYVIAPSSTTLATATIAKAQVTISGLTVANRTYDATTSATVSATGSVTGRTGAMTADTVSLSTAGLTATFGSKNAGVQTATLSGMTLTGLDAGNYTVVALASTPTATIAQAALTLNGVSVASRTYDATTNATVVGTGTLSARTGAMSADTVSLASGALSATFGSKNAGQQTATLTGYSLSGADAANYVAVLAQPSALASITQAQITVSGATVANRTYDATTSATVTGIGSLSARTGAMSADVVSLSSSGLTATFGSKNAGVQTATVSGYTL
ncbi:YDG domain-containing protein, partial [Caballeronia sp. ASUFL_F2_KS49]